uniref:Uncharacterized protein n=1 Tax=Aegilops tauschii TaxID=37682 RepID=M8BQ58_AEGTA
MSTIYMSQLSTLPLMDGDQDQGHFQAFHLPKDPPVLFPFMIDNPVEHQGQGYGDQHSRQQFFGESNQQFNDHMMMSGGSADVFATCSPFGPTIQSIGSDMIQRSSYNSYDFEATHAGDGSTSQWASAKSPVKMRIMRKAPTNDHQGGTARKPRRRAQAHQECAQTATPPRLPCGGVVLVAPSLFATHAAYAKGRLAAPAAAAPPAATNGGVASASSGGVAVGAAQASDASQAVKATKKEKRAADLDRSLPFKKRCKMVDHPTVTTTKAVAVDATPKDQDHVVAEDGAMVERLSKADPPAAFTHGFMRDEITDAAMLLMTLSCGLVRS